ncbi:MAG: hypothetical protein H6Q73_271 [Firmicutes bacterium]|nr:hypothetical protein [Bacillota bacterium]
MAIRGIGGKLILYVSGFIIVAVLASIAPALYFFADNMEKNHEQETLKGMEGLRLVLEDYKQNALNYSAITAGNPAVIRAVEAKDPAAILAAVGPLAKQAEFDFVTVTDERGVVLVRTHDPKKGDNVLNQANVSSALNGTAFSAIEPGTVIRLSARAGAPVKNEQGQIIGVISGGYAASKDECVDRVKQMFSTEVTIFAGDERVSTTILKDGQRVVGTKLNSQIAEKVLNQGQKYAGKADILGSEYITSYMPLMGPDGKPVGVLFAGRNIEQYNAERNRLVAIVGGVTFLILLLGIIGSIWLARAITGPINSLVAGVGKVAAGDLTQRVVVNSKDEAGVLANSFNEMVEHLRLLIFKVSGQAQTLAASSQELNAGTDQSAQVSSKMAETIAEVAAGAEKQLSVVSDAVTIVERNSAKIDHIAANAKMAADMAGKAREAAGNGSEAIETAVDQMAEIENVVTNSAGVVAKLGEQSRRIGQIIETMSAIAGQTNLLALNAAIEAARAGEQGRGFAVVAEEVRKLAEQSQIAAQEIAELITGIQQDTEQAVAAMAKGTEEVNKGNRVVSCAGEAFQEINAAVEQMFGRVSSISAAIGEITAGSKQLVDSVRAVQDISRETLGQTQTVSAATEEQSATMQEMASSSYSLAELAEELQVAVSKFTI